MIEFKKAWYSESVHLNSSIDTGILFNPTSKKATTAKTVVIITAVHVIICDPETSSYPISILYKGGGGGMLGKG